MNSVMSGSETPHAIELYYSPKIQKDYRPLMIHQSMIRENKTAAKIEFQPNRDEFLARQDGRLRGEILEKDLPPNWPSRVSGRLAWKGSDFLDDSAFVYHLSDDERNEVREALKYFKGEHYLSISQKGAS